ncbi:SpoIIE family protein phosphatase [Streptomyces sp. NPDC003011]
MSRVWDIPVDDSSRVGDVRAAAETACAHTGLDRHRTAAVALVATELATNLVQHAGGGRVVINLVGRGRPGTDGPGPSLQLVALDDGPGIADVRAAPRDGCTTAASLGAGLGTCLRVSDDFDLYSTPGRGTVAVARFDHEPLTGPASRESRPPGPRVGGINVSLARDEHSGDAWSWVRSGACLTLMLADGLGHGAKAAAASTAAVEELRRAAHTPPDEILRRLDAALRPTRGAAVAVAQLDEDSGRLRFAGIGNVGGRLRTADGWHSLVSHPGIVGAHPLATRRVQHLPWRRDSLLILHSDGLPGRWRPPDDARLLARDPAVVAAAILRDAGRDGHLVRDDTSVAVLAPRPPDPGP